LNLNSNSIRAIFRQFFRRFFAPKTKAKISLNKAGFSGSLRPTSHAGFGYGAHRKNAHGHPVWIHFFIKVGAALKPAEDGIIFTMVVITFP
jgi:hypothetical protein